jgi:TonB family protein
MSPKVLLLAAFLLVCAMPRVHAGTTDTLFINKDGEFCDRSVAEYLNLLDDLGNNKYKVTVIRTKDNKLKATGFSIGKDSVFKQGTFVNYFDNGQIENTGEYLNNYRTGQWTYYYEDGGQVWYTAHFNEGDRQGELKSYYQSGELKRVETHYLSGRVSDGKCFDKNGKKIKYTEFWVMPKAQYDISRYLSKHIEYPKTSIENNIEGRAIVKFVVDEQGAIKEAEVVKHVSPELDAEALRVVNDMPNWTPGTVDDKNVKVYFNLPIVFKLK